MPVAAADLGRKLNSMTNAGLWDQLSAETSEDVLPLFAAVGRYDQIVAAEVNTVLSSTSVENPPCFIEYELT